MARYIDAEKLRSETPMWLDGTCLVMPVSALDEAPSVPSADVRPVVKGKWDNGGFRSIFPSTVENGNRRNRKNRKNRKSEIGLQTAYYTTVYCTNCDVPQTVTVYNGKIQFNFCPYCGADMREE